MLMKSKTQWFLGFSNILDFSIFSIFWMAIALSSGKQIRHQEASYLYLYAIPSSPCPYGQPLSRCDYYLESPCPANHWCQTGSSSVDMNCCPILNSGYPCSGPRDPGEGQFRLTRWYFERMTGNCEAFFYRGNKGNANNYPTQKHCQVACMGHVFKTQFERLYFGSAFLDTAYPFGVIPRPNNPAVAILPNPVTQFPIPVTRTQSPTAYPPFDPSQYTIIPVPYYPYRPGEIPIINPPIVIPIPNTTPVIPRPPNPGLTVLPQPATTFIQPIVTTQRPLTTVRPITPFRPFTIFPTNTAFPTLRPTVTFRPAVTLVPSFTSSITSATPGTVLPPITNNPQGIIFVPGGQDNNGTQQFVYLPNPCCYSIPATDASGARMSCTDSSHCAQGYWCHVGASVEYNACCVQNAPTCSYMPTVGAGPFRLSRWYYNNETQTCVPFTYYGMQGNANNFLTKEICDATCQTFQRHGVCKTPVLGVPCDQNAPCQSGFWCHYGATAANNICCPNIDQPKCSQPLDVGQGDVSLPRWYMDASAGPCGTCRAFQYRGLYGNQNNFLTKNDCERECSACYSVCPQGNPMLLLAEDGRPLICGPARPCPSTHFCRTGSDIESAVCCPRATNTPFSNNDLNLNQRYYRISPTQQLSYKQAKQLRADQSSSAVTPVMIVLIDTHPGDPMVTAIRRTEQEQTRVVHQPGTEPEPEPTEPRPQNPSNSLAEPWAPIVNWDRENETITDPPRTWQRLTRPTALPPPPPPAPTTSDDTSSISLSSFGGR